MRRPRSMLYAALGWVAVAAVLGGVYMLYLQPDLAYTLASQLWACF
jgi:hypothetical protein